MKDPDPTAPLSPEADAFLAEAMAEYPKKAAALFTGQWRLGASSGWWLDNAARQVHVEFPDGSRWQADAQLLGSYSADQQSWEWAWNNRQVEPALALDSQQVRAIGEKLQIVYLTLPGFPLPNPDMLTFLCSLGLKASDSAGVMEAEADSITMFILLKNLRWTTRQGEGSPPGR